MSRYWTELVNQLDPYVPGEQPQDQQYIKLNTNESPYPPSPRVIQAIESYDKGRLRLYPDPESTRLRQALADRFDTDRSNVFIGNGSDEVLAHSFQAFFKQSQPLLFPTITYSFYPVYCKLYGIDYETIDLADDFVIDIDDYARACGGVIIPNPNAPTSRLLSLEEVAQLCRQTDAVVIIDEAYIDFGGDSAIPLTRQYDNLLVTHTFSKSRSLAGLRLGYAIGDAHLIEGLNRVKNSFNSYPIDSLAQAAAVASIEDDEYFRKVCAKTIATREQLSTGLQGLGFRVMPSAANFVFAEHPSHAGENLYQSLKRKGILVRYFNKPGIDNFLRITVGTDEEVTQLLDKLKTLMA